MCLFSLRRLVLLLAALALGHAAVPRPEEHFGFRLGDDYKLANYAQITSYFEKLAQSSDRIRWLRYGTSSEGRPLFFALISAPENLRRLDALRLANRRLALGEASPAEVPSLIAQARAIVWIDSGLHATETAPAQHAPELAWQLVAGDSPELERIRQNVILLQIPVINPDGLDMVVQWYSRNVGTPYEIARLPFLYQKYAGHDNNRDWFMMNLEETRHASRLLYEEWFPHIVYNQHQRPAFPARIFIPPYADPINPHIPPAVMEGINLLGSAMKERLQREGKSGVLSYFGFDGWWNGGLRSVPAFHNMHGILTETAGHDYATPKTYDPKDFPDRFGNGMPTRQPSIFYPQPWMGGRWSNRDAIDYMLTADFAILEFAASRKEYFLRKAWEMAREQIAAGEKGDPFAYLLPPRQWDPSSMREMLDRLRRGGIRIEKTLSPLEINGRHFEAGTFVLRAAQPFRPYLLDLMEPQRYPEIRVGNTLKQPYDIAGWTLPLQMGVEVVRVDDPFVAALAPAPGSDFLSPETLDVRENASRLAVNRRLAAGRRVRWAADGRFLVEGESSPEDFQRAAWELRLPRVGLYEPYAANMDAGWTQWLLDQYAQPYTLLRNPDLADANLRQRLDAIILASQSVRSLLHGHRPGELISLGPSGPLEENSEQRPEFTGGIGIRGLYALEQFVEAGGTLIALGDATQLVTDLFPLPLRNSVTRGGVTFQCPGSLIRITLNPQHPIAFGMPAEAIAFSTGGQAFDLTAAPRHREDALVTGIGWYAKENLLASGWLSGEKAVAGRHILLTARYGQGHVVLFGFRPQFRGQSFGTFKLLLNALLWSAASPLSPPPPAATP